MRRSAPLRLALFLWVLTACTPTSAPPPEPQDTTEADNAAIEGLVDQWLAAWNAADSAALNALYADDAILILPDGPNILEVQQFFREYFDAFMGRQTATTDEVRVLARHVPDTSLRCPKRRHRR